MEEYEAVRTHWWQVAEEDVDVASGLHTINALLLFLHTVSDGPLLRESPQAYHQRLERNYRLYLDEQDVVGRLQEGREPGYNPGDDEDGAGGEDERPGLRGRGEVRLSRSHHEVSQG